MSIRSLQNSVANHISLAKKHINHLVKGNDERRHISDNSLSKIGRAFEELGLRQLSFPHLTYSKDRIDSGAKFVNNTNNSDDAGLLRWLTRFRGQESRVRFMKYAIAKSSNDKKLEDLANLVSRKRSYETRDYRSKSFRLIQSKHYMPILFKAIKHEKPEVFKIFLENRRFFKDYEIQQLEKAVKKQANEELERILIKRFH